MLERSTFTLPAATGDHAEWHRGRSTYCLWHIGLDEAAVRDRVAAAQEHLAPYLLRPYLRQPHITLFVCGFPNNGSRYDDDYSNEQFDLHAAALRHAEIPPFSIELGRLNSFASAPYLEVRDPDKGIERVRTTLAGPMAEVGRTAYTPHLTVGLYGGAFPSAVVMERISSFLEAPLVVSVDRITFASYEARALAGTLTSCFELALRR